MGLPKRSINRERVGTLKPRNVSVLSQNLNMRADTRGTERCPGLDYSQWGIVN